MTQKRFRLRNCGLSGKTLDDMGMLVCFCGRARVGKTTAALFLKNHLQDRNEDVVLTSIASPLKDAAHVLGFTSQELYEKQPPARVFLQQLGRLIRQFKPDYLLERIAALPNEWVIIDDIRLSKEVEFFKKHGAILIYIDRDVPPANQDPTEIEIDTIPRDRFDVILQNRGTAEEFQKTLLAHVALKVTAATVS